MDIAYVRAIKGLRTYGSDLGRDGYLLKFVTITEGLDTDGLEGVGQLYRLHIVEPMKLGSEFGDALEETEFRKLHNMLAVPCMECRQCLFIGYRAEFFERKVAVVISVKCLEAGLTSIFIDECDAGRDVRVAGTHGDEEYATLILRAQEHYAAELSLLHHA